MELENHLFVDMVIQLAIFHFHDFAMCGQVVQSTCHISLIFVSAWATESLKWWTFPNNRHVHCWPFVGPTGMSCAITELITIIQWNQALSKSRGAVRQKEARAGSLKLQSQGRFRCWGGVC